VDRLLGQPVAPDRITGTNPGDMFVHRNIANLVVQTDMNLLSVLQYAIDVLKVNHLIVCGHYGCGGMKAALSGAHHGPIDNWLRTVKDTQQYFRAELAALDEHARFDRTVELNVSSSSTTWARPISFAGLAKRRKAVYIRLGGDLRP
jgi:carbonic anhydrase